MKNLFKITFLSLSILTSQLAFIGCAEDGIDGINGVDGVDGTNGKDGVNGEDGQDLTVAEMKPLTKSVVPDNVFALKGSFASSANLKMIMTSQDILPTDSTFVYGAFMDGAALYPYGDGTYAFINNLESDYSIARIRMNADLQPLEGDYIVNATATAFTAMCSGSSITVEEHGFGPLYLSGGEWGGNAKGVYKVNPFRSTDDRVEADRLPALGEWSTENAVVIGKDAFPSKTVVFMGDDDSDNSYPEAHFAMYVGGRGDLNSGDLYVLRGKNAVESEPGQGGLLFEMGMAEGTEYEVEWVKVEERTINELNQEAIDSLAIGFQRIEDIDWQKGSAEANRNVFFNATGRYRSENPDLAKRGTTFGRVYKVVLPSDMLDENSENYMKSKLVCVIDGDKEGGIGDGMHSPDNILVTENYAYIQEDPNGYAALNTDIQGYAKLWQYDINTKTMKEVMECNQTVAAGLDIGNTTSMWEITGLIDVTDVIGATEPTFMGGAQVHGWRPSDNPNNTKRADGKEFFDPTAINESSARKEGSFLFKITGLPR
ncbi:phosphatase [Polaribacter sp. WD7]|uniref:phosphatase n=1 Tax=Polaribacter sp. WD7 TaxID=2269061 RepID=UPI000DF3F656|nr:phosphatase [Polaribacter sp. WD7]RCS26549.1 phosphatase [Polaribacter sp. WD7]